MRLGAIVVLAGLLLGAQSGIATPAASEISAPSTLRHGLVTDLTWGLSRAEIDRTVRLMAAAGARTVRMNVSWSGGEPEQGQYNEGWLADVDYAVRAVRAAGIEVLMPIADGVPFWASADPAKSVVDGVERWNRMWKPQSMDAYAAFVRYVVQRYRPLGVNTFEIWNEPNLADFWPSGPNPVEYTAMLRAAHGAVKQAHPTARVLMGGLSANDAAFLRGMYSAGAGAYFDVGAVHPYTGSGSPALCWQDSAGENAKWALCGVETIRKVMVANGDAAKELWLTELGWSTAAAHPTGITEALQAEYLRLASQRLAAYPYVTRVLWYSFRNLHWRADDPASLGANYGLVRTDFSTKPAYHALASMAGATSTTSTTAAVNTTTTAKPTTTTTTTIRQPKPTRVKKQRVAGADRVRTSVALSERTTASAETVVLARADVYADALAAAPLATKHRTSILLTPSTELPASLVDEIARLGASKAIVIGGTGAISKGVEGELRRAGVRTITRLAGANRFDTARLIARELDSDVVVLAEGANRDAERGWPDAITGAAMAAAIGAPVLLVEADRLPSETLAAIAEREPREILVIGGTSAVSARVVDDLGGVRSTRIAGKDRFATSILVAEAARARGADRGSAWVATGRNWPDALAAGPAVAASRAVLVLVDGKAGSAATVRWLAEQRDLEELVVVGGLGSVSEAVEQELAAPLG